MPADKNFYQLQPDDILEVVEQNSFQPTGQIYQLNSYENRVFDIFLEDASRLIVKFYRPGRWSYEAIKEEHSFLNDLEAEGFPAVTAIELQDTDTVGKAKAMYYSFFPRMQAKMPEELLAKDLQQIGASLARLHNVGEQKEITNRPVLDVDHYAELDLDILQGWVEPQLLDRYNAAAERVFYELDVLLPKTNFLRIHGDCHRGNLLFNSKEFFFVDFDDFVSGPVAQDLWMLVVSANPDETKCNLDSLLEGYEKLRHFEDEELKLFEPLRALRIIHYAAWIAKRWSDPSFPKLFPEFNTYLYWAEETESLEKIAWSL